MKLFYTLTLALLAQGFCSAQDLALNSPAKTSNPLLKEGEHTSPVWNKEQDLVNGRIAGSKLKQMKTVTETIVSFLKDSCISEGAYSPVWHAEYTSEKMNNASQMKFSVECEFADQKAHLTIAANDMSSLFQPFAVNNQPFFSMKAAKAVRNEGIYFEGEGDDLKARTWLVTTGDQQPYLIVTRKEYLENAMSELKGIKAGMIADLSRKMPVRSLESQEAEKKALIDQMNNQYSGAELQFRMRQFLGSYKTDQDYLKESADKQTAALDSTFHLMDSMYRNMTKDDAGRAAMISTTAAEFHGFEDGQNDFMLVKMNPGYFNLGVSEEKAQFFVVSWLYNTKAPSAAELDQQLQAKMNCHSLKILLGK